MRLYGLIGNPVTHSGSPDCFAEIWAREGVTDCRYALFPMESLQLLPELIRQHPSLCGLNVTSPFKRDVLSFADKVDDAAAKIGSANVLVTRKHQITAYNTDHIGFDRILDQLAELPPAALVCGSGGAARAVCFSLQRHGIPFLTLSRRPGTDRVTYGEVDARMLLQYPLIVNATPLGMAGLASQCPPLPYDALTHSNILADLVYNPSKTLFLKHGESKGCRCVNGLEMLHGQAEAAWKIWKNYK